MTSVLSEHTQYVDTAGEPAVGHLLYFGTVDSDPVANPITIYSDRELTVPITNPQTLDAYGRTTLKVFIDGKYSLQLNTAADVQIFQDLDAGADTNAVTMTGLTNVLGGNTITATAPVTITSYVDKAIYTFEAVSNNTGPVTLNIDSVGAKSIVQNSTLDIGADEIVADKNTMVMYNSTADNFQIINQKTDFIGYRTTAVTDTIDPQDAGFLIDATSTLTLNLTAAATLGARWMCYIKASGGTITIDPNGAETIDGAATLEMDGGDYAMITCDGTAFHTAALSSNSSGYQEITTSYTVLATDRGSLLDCTAQLALTLVSATSVGPGFFLYIKANGASIVVDPAGAQLINGNSLLQVGNGTTLKIISDGTGWHTSIQAIGAVRNELSGLTLANDGTDPDHDIEIAIGTAASDDTLIEDVVMMDFTSAKIKQIDASWSVGSNAGGLDTGAVAIDTWYHVFIIAGNGVIDALFSLSATAPTMPTGYTAKRRIGSILTDGSANIIAFSQRGDEFLWDTPLADVTNGIATTATLHTMTVPTGVQVLWNGFVSLSDASPNTTVRVLMSSPDVADTAATVAFNAQLGLNFSGGATTINSVAGGAGVLIRTDTSAQVRSRASTILDVTNILNTFGWHDARGRGL